MDICLYVANSTFGFWNFLEFFGFLNIFSLRLVELVEAGPADRADCIHTFSLHSFPDPIINVSKNDLFVLLLLYICIVFYCTVCIYIHAYHMF